MRRFTSVLVLAIFLLPSLFGQTPQPSTNPRKHSNNNAPDPNVQILATTLIAKAKP